MATDILINGLQHAITWYLIIYCSVSVNPVGAHTKKSKGAMLNVNTGGQ